MSLAYCDIESRNQQTRSSYLVIVNPPLGCLQGRFDSGCRRFHYHASLILITETARGTHRHGIPFRS